MINERELRIGNFVIVNNPKYRPDITGKVCVVSGIDSNRPVKYFKSGTSVSSYVQSDEYKDIIGQWIEFLDSIPLTEEWLIRFGFDKNQHKKEVWYSGNDMAIELRNNIFRDRMTGTILNSVHWFQNYYFFKIGKELIHELELK